MRTAAFLALACAGLLLVPLAGAGDATAPSPRIVSKPIPFPAQRKLEMQAYAKRHYGIDSWRLRNPKVIVEHITVSSTFGSAFATFTADRPDAELHELPGTCAHFIVDTDGTIYQLVPLRGHVPPHGRPQLDGDRDRARRPLGRAGAR